MTETRPDIQGQMADDCVVSVIAINYFGSKELGGLLESLQSQTHRQWRLVVVDNSCDAGETGILEQLCQSEDRVVLVSPGENVGYFGGAEFGRVHAHSQSKYIVVCNTDLRLAEIGVLSTLVDMEFSAVGAVAPSVISSRSGLDQNPYMVQSPSVRRTIIRRILMANKTVAQFSLYLAYAKGAIMGNLSKPSKSAHSAGDIYAPHGSFMIFTQDYFVRGCDFAHPLFLFGEELLVAEQCRYAGLRVVYRPELGVFHESHVNTGLSRSRPVLQAMVESARFAVKIYAPRRLRVLGRIRDRKLDQAVERVIDQWRSIV